MAYKKLRKSIFYNFVKRLIDIVSSFILMVIFSPIILLACIAIKLDSRGPILADTPRRVGKNNNYFYPYKFRSMIVNAYYLLKTDPKFKAAYDEQQHGGNYKVKNDP